MLYIANDLDEVNVDPFSVHDIKLLVCNELENSMHIIAWNWWSYSADWNHPQKNEQEHNWKL